MSNTAVKMNENKQMRINRECFFGPKLPKNRFGG